jgi:hypothetical protein
LRTASHGARPATTGRCRLLSGVVAVGVCAENRRGRPRNGAWGPEGPLEGGAELNGRSSVRLPTVLFGSGIGRFCPKTDAALLCATSHKGVNEPIRPRNAPLQAVRGNPARRSASVPKMRLEPFVRRRTKAESPDSCRKSDGLGCRLEVPVG